MRKPRTAWAIKPRQGLSGVAPIKRPLAPKTEHKFPVGLQIIVSSGLSVPQLPAPKGYVLAFVDLSVSSSKISTNFDEIFGEIGCVSSNFY